MFGDAASDVAYPGVISPLPIALLTDKYSQVEGPESAISLDKSVPCPFLKEM